MDYQTGEGQDGPQGTSRIGGTSGFLGSLFDFSFRNFITSKIIGVLYGLSMVVIAIYAVIIIVAAFNSSAVFGAVTLLVLAPLFVLAALIYVRVLLEIAIVLFRIAENTSEMVRQNRR